MNEVAVQTRACLEELIGLPLSESYRAVDMRIFHFGTMKPVKQGAVGEFALHVQCPWRIEMNDKILTGRHDLFTPAEEPKDFDWDSWDWDGNETLQDRLVDEFIKKYPRNVIDLFTDSYGGARIELSGGHSLVLFPAGSQSEDWRLFQPQRDGEHFVISGGRLEADE